MKTTFLIILMFFQAAQAQSLFKRWQSEHGFFIFGSQPYSCGKTSVEVIKTDSTVEIKCSFTKCREQIVSGGANISTIGCPENTKYQINGSDLLDTKNEVVGKILDKTITIAPKFASSEPSIQLSLNSTDDLLFEYMLFFENNKVMVPIKLISALHPAE